MPSHSGGLLPGHFLVGEFPYREGMGDFVGSKGYLTMVYAAVFRSDNGLNGIYGFIQL
jgi:hypothetical protein